MKRGRYSARDWWLGAMAVCLCLLTLGHPTNTHAATITVNAGDDLQAALNSAVPGDTILLQAGATFTGDFVLPVKSGSTFITVRSSAADHLLPAPGSRTGPKYSAYLPKIQAQYTSALATAAASHHWRIENVEFLPSPLRVNAIIALGAQDNSQTTLAKVPHHIVLDRIYLHDDAGGSKRGIQLNSASTAIVNSHIAGIRRAGQEAQAICGWNGPGPFLIENNYIEASTINVLFGGADPDIPNLIPSDITVRRNYMTKQLSWRVGHPSYAGVRWPVKNAFELKNAQRVLIEGNILEHSWVDAQAGYLVLLNGGNDGGKCTWCTVRDVTFTNNIVRHGNGGLQVTGHNCGILPGCDSTPGSNIHIRNNLFYDISKKWDDGAGGGGLGRFAMVSRSMGQVRFDHNTVDNDGPLAVVFPNTQKTGYEQLVGFRFTNNLMRANEYGVRGDGTGSGTAALTAYCSSGYTFLNNVLASDSTPPGGGEYPPTTQLPPISTFNASFANRGLANYSLLTSSSYRGAATDGTDIGVDMTALLAAVAGVEAGVPSTAPAPPANVRIVK